VEEGKRQVRISALTMFLSSHLSPSIRYLRSAR
jgi:hypothetical protein